MTLHIPQMYKELAKAFVQPTGAVTQVSCVPCVSDRIMEAYIP
jgi:hypothetical protein